MGRRALTEDIYDRLLETFRRVGNHPHEVGRAVGVDYRTAVRAWTLGWPKKKLESIQQVIEREQLYARAEIQAKVRERQAVEDRKRQEASENAAKARAQEGQMVQLARVSALQALTVESQLVSSARQLSTMLKERVDKMFAAYEEDKKVQASGGPEASVPIGLMEGVQYMERIARAMTTINHAAHEAMQMERLHFGAPSVVVGVTGMADPSEMTVAELNARAATVLDALSVAAAAGGLKSDPPRIAATVLGVEVKDD